MISRWSDDEARRAIDRWGPMVGEAVALRLYSARLLGADRTLVLHGGGNCSLKAEHRDVFGRSVLALFVKASGADMATLTPEQLPALELTGLQRLLDAPSLDDAALGNELRRLAYQADAPIASIESPVHAVLPHACVDHSHADMVLAITNRKDGVELIRECLGDAVAIIPYVRPGLDLARAVAAAWQRQPRAEGMVLLHHGLITFGDDARTSYERHVRLTEACERFVAAGQSKCYVVAPSIPSSDLAAQRAAMIAPVIRGALAEAPGVADHPNRCPLLDWRGQPELREIIDDPSRRWIVESGPLTGDDAVRTRAFPLVLDGFAWDDAKQSATRVRAGVDAFRRRYHAWLSSHGGEPVGMDLTPRVIIVPGCGMFGAATTHRMGTVAVELAERTLLTLSRSAGLGKYHALASEWICDMETRSLQRRKVSPRAGGPLEQMVVAVSGGAGAIGKGIAQACAEAGACVVLTDVDQTRLDAVVAELQRSHTQTAFVAVHMDVTSGSDVRAGFDEICRRFGGIDVIVPNAGIAHVAAIDELSADDFRRVWEVNAVGCLNFVREGARVLRAQGAGGHVVINASKNVFAPGREFGAYSASKAAAHQLGRVAALDLAPYGIRVNMINADGVFGDAAHPSGLWESVGDSRARSRNVKREELPEYYRQRNLLKIAVTPRHVGNAVVFLASGATPTTGATLPVDGGLAEAFPR